MLTVKLDEASILSYHLFPASDIHGGKLFLERRTTSSLLTSVKSIFAMNVQEINAGATTPLARYLETAFALTAATVWVLFALQSKHRFNKRLSILERIGWPVYFTYCLIQKIRYPEHSRSNKLKEVVAPETV